MQPCTIYLVRHGQSVANRDFLTGGWTDSPLTEKGIEQAITAKETLKNVQFDAVYSSTLQRASKTAEIISGAPVPEDRQLDDLRERSFGHIEGSSEEKWLELDDAFNKQYGHLPLEERWEHSYADYIESNAIVCQRFMQALRGIATAHPSQTVLVGTHGGPVRALLVKLGYAKETELPPGSFTNSAYAVIKSNGIDFTVEKVTGVDKLGLRAT